MPVGGSTSAAYWTDDEIVYATAHNDRGFDILRLEREVSEYSIRR